MIYGPIHTESDLSFEGRLFQKTKKVNTPDSSGNVTVDLLNGNYQVVNTATVQNITVTISNIKIGLFAISFSDLGSTILSSERVISFSGITLDNPTIVIQPEQDVTVYVLHDGETTSVITSLPTVRMFSELQPYAKHSIVYTDVQNVRSFYVAKVDVPAGSFSSEDWALIASNDSSNIRYSDPYNTGNTNVEAALNSLLGSVKFISASYETIDALLLGNATHSTNSVYLVNDVSLGSAADIRVRDGFCLYMKTSSTTGSITDYSIVAARSLYSSEIAFNNAVAKIPGNPTNVRTAIERLKVELDQLLLGVRFIDRWDAITNTPFIANNAFYDDDTFNVAVSSIDVALQTIRVPYTSSTFFNSIRIGNYVKVNDITFTVTSKTAVLSNTAIDVEVEVHDGSAFVNGDISIGQRMYVPNAIAPTGNYYIVSEASAVATENVSIDGVNVLNIEDKFISNGSVWRHIPRSLIATADEISYDSSQANWQGETPENVQAALDLIANKQAEGAGLKKLSVLLESTTIPGGAIIAIDALTGVDTGLTKYTINHGLETAPYNLIIDSYFSDGAVFEKVGVSVSGVTGVNEMNYVEVICVTPTAGEQYVIVVRTE